jgi:hypothetical protein
MPVMEQKFLVCSILVELEADKAIMDKIEAQRNG